QLRLDGRLRGRGEVERRHLGLLHEALDEARLADPTPAAKQHRPSRPPGAPAATDPVQHARQRRQLPASTHEPIHPATTELSATKLSSPIVSELRAFLLAKVAKAHIPMARDSRVRRLRVPVLANTDFRWSCTVCSDRCSVAATSRVSAPVARCPSRSRSRS